MFTCIEVKIKPFIFNSSHYLIIRRACDVDYYALLLQQHQTLLMTCQSEHFLMQKKALSKALKFSIEILCNLLTIRYISRTNVFIPLLRPTSVYFVKNFRHHFTFRVKVLPQRYSVRKHERKSVKYKRLRANIESERAREKKKTNNNNNSNRKEC